MREAAPQAAAPSEPAHGSEQTLSSPAARWARRGLLIAAGVVALAVGIHVARNGLTWGDDGKAAAALLAVELPDVSGKVQRLDQWRGRVLVVNFWATWCVPCREEMPQFIRAQAAQGAQGLQFVGIAVDRADKVQQFSQDLGVNYPVLIGGLGAIELSKSLGNELMALPFTIVLDRQGRVVHTQLGPLKDDKLQKIVAPLLADGPAAT
ncbi:MAG: TlpA family protein disulfide reductase [Rhodospirillaceae bacterium]